MKLETVEEEAIRKRKRKKEKEGLEHDRSISHTDKEQLHALKERDGEFKRYREKI